MQDYNIDKQIQNIEESDLQNWQKAYEKAITLNNDGKKEESINLLKESINLKENNPYALKKLIKIYIKNKDFDKAKEYIEKLNNFVDKDWQLALFNGIISLHDNNLEDAYKQLYWVYKLQPKKSKAVYYLALYYYKKKSYIDSLNYLDELIKLNYKYHGIYILAAKNFYFLKRYKESIENLNEALKNNEDNLEINYFFTLNYLQLKKYKKALTYIDKILKEVKDNAEFLYIKGEILFFKRDRENSLQYLENAYNLNKKNFKYLSSYINAMLSIKDKYFEKIIKTLEQAYNLHKDKELYFLLYAKVLEKIYKYTRKKVNIENAQTIYKKLISYSNTEKEKYIYLEKLFDTYFMENNYKEIINYYLKNPEDITSLNLLNKVAKAYIYLNKIKEAESILEKLIYKYTANSQILYNKFLIFKKRKKQEDAILTLKKILQMDNKFLPAYRELATYLISERKYEDSIKLLKEAIKLQPDDFNTIFLLTESYFYIKEYKIAKKLLQKCLKIQENKNIKLDRYIYIKMKTIQFQLKLYK